MTEKDKKEIEDRYNETWKNIMLDTTPGDMEKAKKIVNQLYVIKGHKEPSSILIVKNPVQGAVLAHMLREGKPISYLENVIETDTFDNFPDYEIDSSFAGASEAFWVGWYDMKEKEFAEKMPPGFDELRQLTEEIGWLFTYSDCAIICEKPTVMVESGGDLHNYEGPAVAFNADLEIYAISGEYKSKEEWETESAPYRCSLGRAVLQGDYSKIEEE